MPSAFDISKIVLMVRALNKELLISNCFGCANYSNDHSCTNYHEDFKYDALCLLYGQGKITISEFTEAINFL